MKQLHEGPKSQIEAPKIQIEGLSQLKGSKGQLEGL